MSRAEFKRELARATFDPAYTRDRCARCRSAYWPCCSVKLTPPKPVSAPASVRS